MVWRWPRVALENRSFPIWISIAVKGDREVICGIWLANRFACWIHDFCNVPLQCSNDSGHRSLIHTFYNECPFTWISCVTCVFSFDHLMMREQERERERKRILNVIDHPRHFPWFESPNKHILVQRICILCFFNSNFFPSHFSYSIYFSIDIDFFQIYGHVTVFVLNHIQF